MSTQEQAFKNRARWLGYTGLIPFVVLVVLLGATQLSPQLLLAGIQSYAAVILTFVGAIHWGRAMNSGSVRLMTLSVWPSVIAWCGLLMPPQYGLPLLTLAFLVLFVLDYRIYNQQVWFRRLRMHLTYTVCVLLVFSWAIT